MQVEILRVSGTREEHAIPSKHRALDAIHKLLQCECTDTVNLRDGRVMLVDDTGLLDGTPVNAQATALYHSIYPRARESGQPIVGDVAIALDEDFA